MATEIERKFLLANGNWRTKVVTSIKIIQGYLSRDETTVRIRKSGNQAWLTIKGPSQGISRLEYEYAIPPADADQMLMTLCDDQLIEKTRHLVPVDALTWEIDEFHGRHHGLIVAELELPHEHTAFERPDWLGQEVSSDPRYRNSYLASNPFSGNP
ncbi:CYTH domain-containing protein [Pseudohongiella spirulinae]|uniref:Adenylate cyclase n=1 Tax=Pseudohongiella spirulinae TaxID=1249552 RepID=A0A0S2KFX4_9GAMM|nr:CYTH domain-containing protein [Pseudohongiella spirulinae]ALO47213.1 adenylate cyclase [Pseudohongiella spirulinae]